MNKLRQCSEDLGSTTQRARFSLLPAELWRRSFAFAYQSEDLVPLRLGERSIYRHGVILSMQGFCSQKSFFGSASVLTLKTRRVALREVANQGNCGNTGY
jgi:hypothetical protein